MLSYEPRALVRLATVIHRHAVTLQVLSIGAGAVAGFLLGGGTLKMPLDIEGVDEAMVGALQRGLATAIGAAVGWIWSSSKALLLKAKAQWILCQVAIEGNTRRTADISCETADITS